MFKNYLFIALRNLKKQKLFSLINVFGMAVGMAGFGIFAISAGTKLNAEKFHENAARIFGVVQVMPPEGEGLSHSLFTPAPLKDALLDEFPEIEKAVRILPGSKIPVKRDDRAFYENDIMYVDPGFLTFFTFNMIAGNPITALSDPNSVVISQSAAGAQVFRERGPGRENSDIQQEHKIEGHRSFEKPYRNLLHNFSFPGPDGDVAFHIRSLRRLGFEFIFHFRDASGRIRQKAP